MANHEKIYGICENKCQHEVYRKDEADETFLNKVTAANSYAIKNHATSKTTYGIGTSTVYGHVQVQTALNIPEQASAGKALAASAGKELNDKITKLNTNMKSMTENLLALSAEVASLRQKVEALEDAQ